MHEILVSWITAFVCGRQQCRRVGGASRSGSTSTWVSPQPTLFGPIVIHINDLRSELGITKYIDDSSLRVFERNCHDSKQQAATDQAIRWSDRNLMRLNGEKTKEIVVDFWQVTSCSPACCDQRHTNSTRQISKAPWC